MGAAQAWMMAMEERGYGESDDHICADCVSDAFLAEWIERNAEAAVCSFCGARADKPIAASFEDFSGVVLRGLYFDWNEPTDEGISYISREGGWQASLSTTQDVLYDAGISDRDDVLEALDAMIDNEAWVERELYHGTDSERLTWAWESFKDYTKHYARYFFLQAEEKDHDGLTPAFVLGSVAEMIPKLAGDGLLLVIGTSTEIVRIRVDGVPHDKAGAIGTPSAEHATQSNRMSPAGIPMFYGALDQETARAETFDPALHAGLTLSVGTFIPLRELTLLNLADLPPVPSVFDEDRQKFIHSLRFLDAFAADMSQPIARDGREHVDYVPTQIVTEFFRRIFRLPDGSAIDGIAYGSAKKADGKAVVLFCENAQCVDPNDAGEAGAIVQLVAVDHQVQHV